MKRRIRKFLMGDAVFSEYPKITVPDEIQEKVWLDLSGNRIDVSPDHWVLCIEPIVFGVWVRKEAYPGGLRHSGSNEAGLNDGGPQVAGLPYGGQTGSSVWQDIKYRMHFSGARLTLDLFDHIEEKDGALLLLRLKRSRLRQLNFIKTWLLFFRYYRRGGLTFSRFKDFVSAYSYPRRVRLISFRQENYYNIFPMDLLGDIPGQQRYVFGLRHTNLSLPLILATNKIVVAEVGHEHKEIIYQLGKHHSGSPPPLDQLPFGVTRSREFDFYVPDLAESYKEVRILKTIDLGSHMLLWGEPMTRHEVPLHSADHSDNDPADRASHSADHLYLVHFLQYLHQEKRGGYKLV